MCTSWNLLISTWFWTRACKSVKCINVGVHVYLFTRVFIRGEDEGFLDVRFGLKFHKGNASRHKCKIKELGLVAVPCTWDLSRTSVFLNIWKNIASKAGNFSFHPRILRRFALMWFYIGRIRCFFILIRELKIFIPWAINLLILISKSFISNILLNVYSRWFIAFLFLMWVPKSRYNIQPTGNTITLLNAFQQNVFLCFSLASWNIHSHLLCCYSLVLPFIKIYYQLYGSGVTVPLLLWDVSSTLLQNIKWVVCILSFNVKQKLELPTQKFSF